MYPYILLKKDFNIFPIFWKEKKNIFFLSMEDWSEWIRTLSNNDIKNQKIFQEKIEEVMTKNNTDIVISWYLENRKRMFSVLGFKQMISEWRIFHLWLDLSIKKDIPIYAPLNSKVYDANYEKWDWNYGWYIILEHNIDSYKFYTLYWHLNPNNFLIKKWDKILKWTKLWTIWDFSHNWGYFFHTHLQVITELWKKEWFFNKWYCKKEQIKDIEKYVPNPNFLFRY